jgi:hypothetical protein
MSDALDGSGLIAERYGASSIPQTVIIDRSGVVSRVFVSASGNLEDRLRKSLESALTPESAPTR